jgi:flavin reductase (DIM6/NTAB) family NADH-FMN oxidoreductase RutF
VHSTPIQDLRQAPVVPTAAEMRHVLRLFVTGVTIVTAFDEHQRLVGATANSFTSVSLAPPLVLVCLGLESRTYRSSVACGSYAINILASDQAQIASEFATRGGDRAGLTDWRISENGYPVLGRSHAALECQLVREVVAGDHAILIGRVEAFGLHAGKDPQEPLVFYGGKMFPLQRP